MTFQFRPAVREQTKLLISLAGSSGSGKTYSALRLARGLAGPDGRIAVLDTEAKRALHYADQFQFDHGDLVAPFRPATYLNAIKAAEAAGYDVIVIDSMSHEYEGEGGVLQWAEQLANKMKPPKNWVEPKIAHKRMVQALLQVRSHIIFCMRADQKMRLEKVGGKIEITPAEALPPQERWKPITEKSFIYEMTTSLLMTADRPGVPIPIKLQEQHRPAFPEGQPVTEGAGAALGEWANGGSAPTPRSNGAVDSYALAEAAAQGGKDTFTEWWNGPGKPHRAAVKSRIDDLREIAEAVDAGNAEEDDNPFAEHQPAHHADGVVTELESMTITEFQDALEAMASQASGDPKAFAVWQQSIGVKQMTDRMTDQQRSVWAEQIHEVSSHKETSQ